MSRKKPNPDSVDAVSKIVNDRFVWTFYAIYGKRRRKINEEEYNKFLKQLPAKDINIAAPGHRGKRVIQLSNGEKTEVSTGWPMKSEALAVHPSQVAQMNARNKKHGVNVQYCPKWGTAIIPDSGAYKRLRKLENARHNNSYN